MSLKSNANSKIKLYSSSRNPELTNKILDNKSISFSEFADFCERCKTTDLMNLSSLLRNNLDNRNITYSRKIFINLVNLCKDKCSYCTYKKEPESLEAVMLKPEQAISLAKTGKKLRCTEALIVTGERPETKYSVAKSWLKDLGFRNLIELISHLSDKILNDTGLLPHTNAGSLTKKEMNILKKTNVSLGMMLENISEKLLEEGMVHENAPSKNPKVRLKSLISAGELKIPITTGLLIGIGEEISDVIKSLYTIRELNIRYGNIQEVIIQNFSPKTGTSMEFFPKPTQDYFLKCIAISRIILKDINIQVPPNLSPSIYSSYIDAGINDWGGISPLTPDYVNPEYPWPSIDEVKYTTMKKGFNLRARLPIYPKYITNSKLNSQFINDELKKYIEPLVDKYGLVKEEYVKDEC